MPARIVEKVDVGGPLRGLWAPCCLPESKDLLPPEQRVLVCAQGTNAPRE